MSNLKKRILNKEWVSHGKGWTFQRPKKEGVVPRYGVVFTCVDAPPVVRKGFQNRSHWRDRNGRFSKRSYGPVDVEVPCVRFKVTQPALPAGFPAPDPSDDYEPTRDTLDKDFLAAFRRAKFLVVDNCLIAPQVAFTYQNDPYTATFVITFKGQSMLLRAYWSDGYEGGYCCP